MTIRVLVAAMNTLDILAKSRGKRAQYKNSMRQYDDEDGLSLCEGFSIILLTCECPTKLEAL